jgi:type VI secretion system secreted protein Hcp
MSVYIQYLDLGGRILNVGKGKVHGMKQNGIEIHSFNMGVQSPRDASTGLASGKRQHEPLTIIKEVDPSSPALWGALVNSTDKEIPTLKLHFVTTNPQGATQPYFTITLTNASLGGYKRNPILKNPKVGKIHNSFQLEEIAFTFQKIEFASISGKKSFADDWEAGT